VISLNLYFIQVHSDLGMAIIELAKGDPSLFEGYGVPEIKKDQLDIGSELGKGHFGTVDKGTIRIEGME
jgi:hypothetical protein